MGTRVMKGKGIRILTLSGIELRLDYSWFILFGLITLSFTTGILPTLFGDLTGSQTIATGVAAALLLFVSVVIHEYAHALYAKKKGLRINRISLFLFGGAAELEDEPKSPGQEFVLAGLGPLSSLIIAGLFGLLWQWGRTIGVAPIEALGASLALVNVLLALFNLLPGFPLDGGRLFRAVIWKLTGDMLKATKAAANAGKLFAGLLFVIGLWQVLIAGVIGGIWLILIAVFLYNAARAGYQQAFTQHLLRNVRVSDLMDKTNVAVPHNTEVSDFLQEYVKKYHHTTLPVASTKGIAGMVSADDVATAPPDAPVAAYARGNDAILKPTDPATRAINMMGSAHLQELPVARAGRLVGVISLEHIRSQLLSARIQHGM